MTSLKPVFHCSDIRIRTADKDIVTGVNLEVFPGEIHALMGPNGSGKSTFAAAVMGHPHYDLTGSIVLDGQSVESLPAHERARRGLFLGFQYPVAIPGVTVAAFLRAAVSAVRGSTPSVFEFKKELDAVFERLQVPASFGVRYLNDGFSGGEKKRLEILQMRLLKPRFAILDEIDSGLDVDALKTVSQGITEAAAEGAGVLLVTHYQRLLELAVPTKVHYFMGGKIVLSGGVETVKELEKGGYDWLRGRVESAAGGVAS